MTQRRGVISRPTYEALRDFPNAVQAIDRAIAVAPRAFDPAVSRGFLYLYWKGDFEPLEHLMASFAGAPDPDGNIAALRGYTKALQRKYDDAVQALIASPSDVAQGKPKSFFLGLTYWAAQDEAKARANFLSALPAMEAAVRASPQSAMHHIVLGQAYAGLGRREEAVAAGLRATELLPETVDAYLGPDVSLGLAEIYAILGDADSALPILEHSLSSRVGVTVHRLRLDPVWDPIRNDARFQALVAKYGGSS